MRACPRCGNLAEDEIVCSNCGLSLAAGLLGASGTAELMDDLGFIDDEDAAGAAASTGSSASALRVATFVTVTILLIVVTSIFLINMGGGGNKTVGEPSESQTSTIPIGLPNSLPSTSLAQPSTSLSTSVHYTHLPPLNPSSSSSKSSSSAASHPPTSGPGGSTFPTSTPTTGSSTSTNTTSPPPAPGIVTLSKGSPSSACGSGHPHCFYLIVSLTNFSFGPHEVVCEADTVEFGSYVTTATNSAGCSFSGSARVQVVVDGKYPSNVVNW